MDSNFYFFFAHILSEKVNIKNFTFTPKRQHLCMPRFSAPTDFDQDRIFLFLYIFSGHRRRSHFHFHFIKG